MKTDQQRACPQRISVATLSAWRDGDLSHVEAERLRAHIADCAVCQQTIAAYTMLGRALQRGLAEGQHESSRRQDRLWRALRARILWQQGRQGMNTPKALVWRSVGVAVTVLLLAGLALQFWHVHTSSVAQTPRATATPQQTPAPLDPTIAKLPTLTQAWGTHAITFSQSVGQSSDGYPNFTPIDIAPDGTIVVGYSDASYKSTHTTIEMLTVATGKLQQLANVTYAANANSGIFFPGNVKTDGNYIVWLAQPATGWQIIVYDVQRGTQTPFQIAQSAGESFTLVAVDHGQLIWIDQHNGGHKRFALKESDLGTQATTDILPQGEYQYLTAVESWPNIFYTASSYPPTNSTVASTTSAFLYNVATHKQSSVQGNTSSLYFLFGATLYSQKAASTSSNAALEVDQLQHADQPGAMWQKLLTLPWTDDNTATSSTSLQSVTNRLLILGRDYASAPANLIAWDTARQRLVLIEPKFYITIGHGDWLAYLSADTAKTYTLHIINTAQLP